MRQMITQKHVFFLQGKTEWHNFCLELLLLLLFFFSFNSLSAGLASLQRLGLSVSGSLFGAPPCRPAHTSQSWSIMACLTWGDINNESWSRNHSGEHKRDREGTRRPQLALLQVSSFDTPLMVVWWVHMGQHGFIRPCLHNIYGVYTQPTNPFLLSSEGGFSCGTLLRKKQLRIPKQRTTMGDIIGAMCAPCPSQFLSGMSRLFLICAQPNPPTEKPQIEWRREGGDGWA